MSCLKVSCPKSERFFCGIMPEAQSHLASLVGLKISKLPVRYLGVPLIAEKMNYEDCKPLIDKITFRITSWTSRFLTFAGKLQLINFVLFNMQIFWCSMSLLPTRVIKEVENICSSFLWKGATDNA